MRRNAWLPALAGLLLSVLVSVPAHAQATRTWVSGVGDDANPCSRTAPCKTFAGAISKTATLGEINCLDPGGYGTLTITKSIAIDCTGTYGSILAAGTNGITINVDSAAGMIVRLRGLSISGVLSGLKGVSIIGTSTNDNAISIEDCVIDGFTQQAILFSAKNGRFLVRNTSVRNNYGAAVSVAAASGASTAKATFDNVSTFDSGYGFAIGNGAQVVIKNSIASQHTTGGIEGDAGSTMTITSSIISGNGTGIITSGIVRMRDSDLSYNTTGISGTIQSNINNNFLNNGAGGTVTPVAGGVTNPQGLQ